MAETAERAWAFAGTTANKDAAAKLMQPTNTAMMRLRISSRNIVHYLPPPAPVGGGGILAEQ
ncbi:MAG TPA: hypothetical protein VIL34_02310 [Actinopolymorphaceae bacterium]